MTISDTFWLDKCEELPGRYVIYVDNDEVYVFDSCQNKEVYTFSEYGWRFALSVLRHVGCSAEEV